MKTSNLALSSIVRSDIQVILVNGDMMLRRFWYGMSLASEPSIILVFI